MCPQTKQWRSSRSRWFCLDTKVTGTLLRVKVLSIILSIMLSSLCVAGSCQNTPLRSWNPGCAGTAEILQLTEEGTGSISLCGPLPECAKDCGSQCGGWKGIHLCDTGPQFWCLPKKLPLILLLSQQPKDSKGAHPLVVTPERLHGGGSRAAI